MLLDRDLLESLFFDVLTLLYDAAILLFTHLVCFLSNTLDRAHAQLQILGNQS